MRVIGTSLGHDSSVCLVEDGKIIRHIQEERFSRIKVGVNSAIQSLKFCLGDYKIEDIDLFTISSGLSGSVMPHYQGMFKVSSTLGIPLAMKAEGYDVKNVIQIQHHECHAGSAYYTSGFDEALIVSIDGIGEETTILVSEGKGKKIRPLYIVKRTGISLRGKDGVFRQHVFKRDKILSLGWFYGMVTEALGWRLACDEGKTMGLAPYGDPNIIPPQEIRKYAYKYEPGGFYLNDGRVYYHFAGAVNYKKLADKYGRENLAAAAQKMLEDKILRFCDRWLKRTGHKNLCTAGGVFANVKLNQKIVESRIAENYWAFPLATDVGVSIGAALCGYWNKTEEPYKAERITHLYYGSEYRNDEIKRVLDLGKLRYKPYDVKYVAGKLAENKIVGWFQGKMESGPRALGGRSILMSPLVAANKNVINAQVKFREAFRPFCPSVIEEVAGRYFDGGGNFMITACNVRGHDIPAVTHVDGTARPQIVRIQDNQKFHKLIDEFGGITGHPVLLNTSLNVMGNPISRTPTDAIQCFYSGGIDILVLGDYMIEKEIQ